MTGADPVDPAIPSFAGPLFTGRLPAAMAMPHPRLNPAEQHHVDTLIANAREFLDVGYDRTRCSSNGGTDIVRGLGERSLLGLYVAAESDGPGRPQTGCGRVMEEFGGYTANLPIVTGVHQSIGMKPIHLFGSDDQKARFCTTLPPARRRPGPFGPSPVPAATCAASAPTPSGTPTAPTSSTGPR